MTNPITKKNKSTRRKFITTFFILLFIGCLASLYSITLLKRGVYLDNFTVSKLSLEKFSLSWDDKLSLDVGKVIFPEHSEDKNKETSKSLKLIRKNLKLAHFVVQFFSNITIHSIVSGDVNGKIEFSQSAIKDSYSLNLFSDNIDLQTNLYFLDDQLSAEITRATIKSLDTILKGDLKFDLELEQITGTISANVANHLPLNLDISANSNEISFINRGTVKIQSIKPVVDLFGLDPNIQLWVTSYLSASNYTLESLEGVIPWADPAAVLTNLNAKVTVDECAYIFAPGLEPIKTSHTDVKFTNGILKITPHNSTFYGQDIDEGQVDINFVDPTNIFLTTHILTEAKLNDDILNLLNHYDIEMPFKQTAGQTGVDFFLTIYLSQLHVTTKGTFEISQGEIIWNNNKFAISNTEILQSDSNIQITRLTLQYEKLFTADIAGKINPAKGVGDLEIKVQQFELKLGQSVLRLETPASLPTINYHLRPDGDSVDISSSTWDFDGLKLTIAAFRSPFLTDKLALTLPPTAVSIGETIETDISGILSLKDFTADLSCNLKKYEVNDILLVKPVGPIVIRYDQGLAIENTTTSQWKLSNIATTLYPAKLNYTDQTLSIIDSRISYGDFFDSTISGHYNRLNQNGRYLLEDLVIKNQHVGQLIGDKQGIPIDVSKKSNSLIVNVPQLDLNITSGENKNWSATFHDLSTIYPRSKVLQQYKLDKGSLIISSANGKKPYDIKAEIPYNYPLLVKDNNPIHQLHIEGEITDQGFSAVVNDQMKVHYDDQLTITSDDIGYNIPAIIKLISASQNAIETDHRGKTVNTRTANKDREKLHISLKAKNSCLFFETDHKALADQLTLEYDGTVSTIQLLHEQGNIDLEIKGNQFSLNGGGLGDKFMGALIQGSQFDKGTMTLAAKGSFSESSALLKVENSTLKSLNPINNILAFLNTIPALITFSLPEYSTKGMYLNSAVIGLSIKDNIAHVKHLDIKSPVLSMTGTGWFDIPKNAIDMKLNLITKAKTNISKIPLLGYVLTGKEKRPSIALQLSGDLNNPDVKNTVFKEVATLPFSLLYRTLTLPVHMANSVLGFAEDNDKTTNRVDSTNVEKTPKNDFAK